MFKFVIYVYTRHVLVIYTICKKANILIITSRISWEKCRVFISQTSLDMFSDYFPRTVKDFTCQQSRTSNGTFSHVRLNNN